MAKKTTDPKPPEAPETPPKIGKVRSPNYPVIDLGKALEKATLLHTSYRTTPVSFKIAVEKWGYKPDSSVASQTVAALKSFGLAAVDGTGDDRKVSVTDAAVKIIMGHPSRDSLLQSAALAPRIHRELWDKFFSGKAAPDPDDLIKHYLQWERADGKFNHESISPFLNQFKRTIAFAKVVSSAKIPDTPPVDDPDGETGVPPVDEPNTKPKQPLPPGVREFSFPLMNGAAVLKVPHPMGQENFDLLDAMLKAAKAALVGKPADEPK